MSETAYKDGTCSECHGPIRKGSPIKFKKGARRDGSEVSIPIHEHCPPEGQAQAKLPEPGSSMAAAGIPPEPVFVQIAAWVPIDRIEIVAKAIREARS